MPEKFIFRESFVQGFVLGRLIRLFSPRRLGRVVECAGLENRSAARYRGFESLSLRQLTSKPEVSFFYAWKPPLLNKVYCKVKWVDHYPGVGWSDRAG